MTLQIKNMGVFDSGVGGLTVLNELHAAFPETSFVYLGDTARVPYGSRSPQTIIDYAFEDALFLKKMGAEFIVVACNTATAMALPYLENQLDIPLMGVVAPGVDGALSHTKNKRVGLIGTEGTILSKAYENLIAKADPQVTCFSKATPALVPFVEEGLFDPKVLTPLLDYYLSDFKKHDIDTLILGCTHYPVIHDSIKNYFLGKVHLVDSSKAIIKVLKEKFGTQALGIKPAPLQIYVTDLSARTQKLVGEILKTKDFSLLQTTL